MRCCGRCPIAPTPPSTCISCPIATRATARAASAMAAQDASVLIDATLKENFPPISLPKREYMENARKIWEELGLPKLKPEAPWFGYSLGEWSDDLDAAAARGHPGRLFRRPASDRQTPPQGRADEHRSPQRQGVKNPSPNSGRVLAAIARSGGVRAARPSEERTPPRPAPKPGREKSYGATIASGLPRWRLTISLLSAPR